MKNKSSTSDSPKYIIVAKKNGAQGSLIAHAATADPAAVVGSLASNPSASKSPAPSSGKGRNRDPVPPGDEQPRAVVVQSDILEGESGVVGSHASATTHRQSSSSSAQSKLIRAVIRSDPHSSSASSSAHDASACMDIEGEPSSASASSAQPTSQPQPQPQPSDLSPEAIEALLSSIGSHSSSEMVSIPVTLVRLLLTRYTQLSSELAEVRRMLASMGGGSLPGKEGPSIPQRSSSDMSDVLPAPSSSPLAPPSSPSPPQPTNTPPSSRGRPPQPPSTARPPPPPPQPPAPSAPRPAKSRGSVRSAGVDALAYRKSFLLKVPATHTLTEQHGYALHRGLVSFFQQQPAFGPGGGVLYFQIQDVVHRGPSRILFTVSSLLCAETVVRLRHHLKGSGCSIFDVLSPEESKQHAALWPRFLEERAAGRRVQFDRARLKVDGVWVKV